jgi:phage/plasmid-associated DNA primase
LEEKNFMGTIGQCLPLSIQIAINIVQIYRVWLIRDAENGKLYPVFYKENVYIEDKECNQIRAFIKAEILTLFNYKLGNAIPGENPTDNKRLSEYVLADSDFEKYESSTGYVNSLVSNAIRDILDFNNIIKNETDFDNNAYEINTLNGIYDIKTGKLLPHSPNTLVRNIVNANYIGANTSEGRKANSQLMETPSLLIKLIADALYDKTLNDIENKSIIQSFMNILASCLIGNNREKLVYVIVGVPNSGKSTLLNVLQGIFSSYCGPFSNTALMVSPRTKNDIRPDLIACRNRRIWVGSESNKNAKFDNALLKQIAGNDTVSFRRPHKGTMIEFIVKGKLILVTNFFPTFSDIDDVAFLNRIVLVDFINTPTPKDIDTNLEQKLLLPESRDQIFTYLADLAHRQYVTDECFIHERFATNKERVIINQNSSVALFWKEHICPYEDYNRTTWLMYKNPVKVLYAVMYRDFCRRIKVNPLPLEAFAKEFKMLSDINPIVSWQKGNSNNFYYGFKVVGGESEHYYHLLNQARMDNLITEMLSHPIK